LRISIALDRCHLIVLLSIPPVVVLSTCMGVGGCGCPSSSRTRHSTLASCVLRNSAPSSASAADAATSLRMVQVIWIAPLIMIGLSSCGILPKKK
jgi:hypothetical protein